MQKLEKFIWEKFPTYCRVICWLQGIIIYVLLFGLVSVVITNPITGDIVVELE